MVIALYTNTEFANDIADELRLFVDAAVLQLPSEQANVRVTLEEDGWTAVAWAALGGAQAQYVWRHTPETSPSPLARKRQKKRAVKIAAFRMMRQLFDTAAPWGSLTGIRPTRLYRELLAETGSAAGAGDMMRETFDVSPEKLALLERITAVQQPVFATQTPLDMDVYVGVPFCKTRCLYCSFLSAVRTDKTDMEAYLAALRWDIEDGARTLREGGYRLRAVYMGGGTPTVLTAGELERVLGWVRDAYGSLGMECTVEAGRPDTIDKEKLRVLRDMGVGRISVNPQSMNEKTLARIGRSHTPAQIVEAMALAREAGFANINMDVIAGLPGETEEDMRHTLGAIAALSPEALTVHTLALKRSSRLRANLESYPLPDAQTAEAMVARGAAAARSMGMTPYYMYRQKYMRGNLENVGYALPGLACLYNVDMMEETTNIMAHGAGAMSKRIFGGERRVERIPNPKDIDTYIHKLEALSQARRAFFL